MPFGAAAFPGSFVPRESAERAYGRVVQGAGAVKPVRDAVDRRIVEEVETVGGRLIQSQRDLGARPEYRNAASPLDRD